MVYIQEKISSGILEKRSFLNDIECLFPELKRLSLFKEVATLRNVSSTISKWSILFNHLDRALDTYSNCKIFLLVGDST